MYSRKDNLKRHWRTAHPQVSFPGATPTKLLGTRRAVSSSPMSRLQQSEEVPMPPPIPLPAGTDPFFWPLYYNNYTFCNDPFNAMKDDATVKLENAPSCDIPATDCYLYRTQDLYGSNPYGVGHSIEPPNYLPSHTQQAVPLSTEDPSSVRVVAVRPKPQCWEHGCNGRQFSTSSNLLRHQRQKSGNAVRHKCPNCSASFTRKMARNDHRDGGKCKQPARRSRSGE